MKRLIFSVLTLPSCISFAQEIKLQDYKGKEVSISDTTNNYRIVVDSSHLYVSVYDKYKKLIWKNYTEECNYCEDCKEPKELYSIELAPVKKYFSIYGRKPDSDIGIFVSHCICFGYFELKTGKYVLWGCD